MGVEDHVVGRPALATQTHHLAVSDEWSRPGAATSRSGSGYRSDIDGLRGLAVVAVLLFHVDLSLVPGGFVGVDLFFVISGFLITNNIIADVEAGTFTFSGFYARRARRLFPALFVTLAGTFLCGALLFSPRDLRLLAKSVVFALGSISNFLFWSEAGYFDVAARIKPLLHTWSLAVEEQFYLVWPCALVVLLKLGRRWAVWLFLLIGGATSVYFAGRWALSDTAGAFYLAPFRVMEFAVGGACVPLVAHQPKDKGLLEPALAVGLSCVVAPIFMYDEQLAFAGAPMLVPCLGAALLIYAGAARYLGWVLRNPVAVLLGKISYSLYLVHWPIVVFYRYYRTHMLGSTEQIVLSVAAIVVAALMYRFVETPFRVTPSNPGRLSPARTGAACVGLALLLGLPAASIWQGVGWELRYPPAIALMLSDEEEQRRTWQWDRAVRFGECFMFSQYIEHGRTCLSAERGKSNFLVLGDSHAADLWAALRSAYPDANLLQATGAACTPVEHFHGARDHPCNRMLQHVKDQFRAASSLDGLILSAQWRRRNLEALENEIDYWHEHRIPLAVAGPTPEFEPEVPTLISRFGQLDGLAEFCHSFRVARTAELDAKLRALVTRRHVSYLDRIDLFCDDSRCEVVDANGRLMFRDYGHWTVEGHQWAGRRLAARFPRVQDLFVTSGGARPQ